jgi:hypothetical protein
LGIGKGEVVRVVAKEVTEHVDHQDHGAEKVQGGCSDGVPEALSVCLVGTIRRGVDFHARSYPDEKASSEVPEKDGGGQCDDVSDTLGEVEEEEDVAHEAAYERGHVNVVAPRYMSVSSSLLITVTTPCT